MKDTSLLKGKKELILCLFETYLLQPATDMKSGIE